MVQIKVVVGGLVNVLTAVRGVGEGGAALNGTIASFSSLLPYASYIETGKSSRATRRAGPALMFQRGVAETAAQAPAILGPAIPKGSAAVGAAVRKLRDSGITAIRKYTPVRTGALRDSVRVLERPG